MKNPNFRIGMTSVEALVEIIRANLNRSSGLWGEFVSFYTYVPKGNTRDRKVNTLSQLLFHDPSEPTDVIRGRGITVDSLNEKIGLLQKDSVLAILSAMRISPSYTYHIVPMMDFHCPTGLESLSRIEQFLKVIRQKEGVILDSGRSYHYYGVNLMDGKEWLDFLGDCLLSGLVDVRHVGHRLKDRCGILRISACPLRPKIPTVVSIL